MEPDFVERLVGQTLSERYLLVKPLGHGGYGTVFTAMDQVIRRQVAIKVMYPRHQLDEAAVRRFRREARIMGSIRHENVVQVLDYGQEGSLMFIVMELLTGVNPVDLLSRGFPLSPPRTLGLLVQILSALEEAHHQGVVHRDLKPDNVVIETSRDGQDRVKVLDFGVARLMEFHGERATIDLNVAGTPEYMSPEQIRGEELDGRSDLYAVGCLLYLILCGRPPFLEASSFEVMMAHQLKQPPPPSTVAGAVSVSPLLENTALWCLAKKREDRPQSAEFLMRYLRENAHLNEVVARAPEISPAPRSTKGETRRTVGAPPSGSPIGAPDSAARLLLLGIPEDTSSVLAQAIRDLGGYASESEALEEYINLLSWDGVIIFGAGPDFDALAETLNARGQRFLAVGADEDIDLIARAVEAGAFEFIPSPVVSSSLARTLARLVKARRTARPT